MDTILQFAITGLLALLCISVLPWAVYVLLRFTSATLAAVNNTVTRSFTDVGERFGDWRTQRNIQEQLKTFASTRTRVNRGARMNDVYTLAALLKRTVSGCNMVHHYAADALGVEHYEELEENTVCAAYRTRVVQITDTVLDKLVVRDVVVDPTKAKMLIGMDRMRDMCADCVLLKYSRSVAPRLCDPAIHMGCTEDDERKL